MIDEERIHREAVVVDMHCDTALRLLKGGSLDSGETSGHVSLDKLGRGGIDLQVFACWISSKTPAEECRALADRMLDKLCDEMKRYPDEIEVCSSAVQAKRIIDSGRIAALLAIENGVAIENDLGNLDHFYTRGVRCLTLTHASSNDWCISSADPAPAFDGLSEFGCRVVHRMNELGMIIDVSHAHPAAVRRVLELSSQPVIASHSCVHRICPHDRNLTDDQIKKIAEKGGIIGVNFFCGYLSWEWHQAFDCFIRTNKELIESYKKKNADDYFDDPDTMADIFALLDKDLTGIKVDVGMVIDHIDHIVRLVGSEHVGLGSDFDGVWRLPEGLTDCSMMPNITIGLSKRGYKESDIEKILGGNFMRVFEEICR